MKTRNPLDRTDLSVDRKDCVLEVGSGHNPSYRSNVLAEKYIDNNYHRADDVKIFPHQTLVNVPGEALPFKDQEFDYVICCQVLEHAEDPAQFIKEQCRVARRGYMEAPSLIGEALFPKESHKWVILEIDNKLIIYDKFKIKGFCPDFGDLFLTYLPYQSIAFRLLTFTHGDLLTVRYEWEDNIDFVVNPEDEYYTSFFTKPWTSEMMEKIFPPRSLGKDFWQNVRAFWHVLSQMTTKKRTPLSICEYESLMQKNKYKK